MLNKGMRKRRVIILPGVGRRALWWSRWQGSEPGRKVRRIIPCVKLFLFG